MSANVLYAMWIHTITQLWPAERKTRRQNLALLVASLSLRGSVHLSRIANALPCAGRLLSRAKRLDRFLENPAFTVQEWYEPLAQHLLAGSGTGPPLRLILDATQVALQHQLLLVSLAYRKRVLPLAWEWVPYRKGRTPAALQVRLLEQVARWLPPGAQVILIGDADFGTSTLILWLQQQGWQYVLRQTSAIQVRPHAEAAWVSFDTLAERGVTRWREGWFSVEDQPVRTNLVAHWESAQPEPWLLATNLPTCAQALGMYRRRMWTEESFGDLKGHGLHLDESHLRDAAKLDRLTFAVFLLYLQFLTEGAHVLRSSLRRQFDRPDRRDLSVFQLGLRRWQWCLANERDFKILFNPFLFHQTVR